LLELYANQLEEKIKTAKSKEELDFFLKEQEWFLEKEERFLYFEHRPLPIEEWIESPFGGNLNEIIRSRIKEIMIEIFKNPNKYQEVVIDGGIGIGKSFLSARSIAYMLHRLLCLRNPHAFFGLAKGSPIAIMNCSVNGLQAKKVVFGEIVGAVESSPWFKIHGYEPDPNVKSELRFPKAVEVIPGNSRELFFVGFDLYAGVIDEAAWHIVTEEKDYAEEAYNQMINRIKSRFGNYGKLFMISSPRYIDDFVERKMKENNSKIYGIRVPFWESPPPTLKFSGKVFYFDTVKRIIIKDGEIESQANYEKIPIELLSEFERDPIRAWRDLGAQPTEAIEAYYPDSTIARRNANYNRKNPWDDNLKRFADWFETTDDRPRYIHIDPSLKFDKTGFAMGYQEGSIQIGNEMKPKVVIDVMFALEAPPGGEVRFEYLRELIYLLQSRGFNIAKVSYDGFQSADSIQILKSRGIDAEVLSCDKTMAPHEMLKSAIIEKRIDYPPYELFFEEIAGLELIKGKKVDHRPKGSKDVADAVAGVVYWICQTPVISDKLIDSGGKFISEDPNVMREW